MTKPKITLGLDSSTTATGYAFRSNGTIYHGVIKGRNKDWFLRSQEILEDLKKVTKDFKIVNLVIEKPIKKMSIDATIKCAIANGMLIGGLNHEMSMEVLPSEWRSWYGLKTANTKGQAKRNDYKKAAIIEVLDMGLEIEYTIQKDGTLKYSDDEAEAILILLAAERKGL